MSPTQSQAERGSAEWLVQSGILHGIVSGFTGFIFTPLLQARGHLPGGLLVWLAGTAIAFGIGAGIARGVLQGTGRVAKSIYAPDGDTTRYTPTYSHIEALEVRGDLDGAAAAWDQAILESPDSAVTIVRAADFQLRARKDAERARALYTQARATGAGTDDLKRYVQQKLVDLYLGPLRDEGRALVELRRLIEGFPGTREAESARQTLAELKRNKLDSV